MMAMMHRALIIFLPVILFSACKPKPKPLEWEVVGVYPHQTDCYTQGLEFYKGALFESGGQYGESKLRRVESKTGEVLRERRLPAQIFSEGLTVVGDDLWLLTWKAGKAYVFDRETFELKATHHFEGEGWGLAWNGEQLIMSNGTNKLMLRNPQDFSIEGEIEVMREGKPQSALNELEYVDGEIYANIYQHDIIVRVDAKNGNVTGVLELSELRKQLTDKKDAAEVLNGIAHHPETGHLWVTGKNWSEMFEIKLK